MNFINALLLAIPVTFLVLSVVLVTKSFNKRGNAKRSMLTQLVSFGAVLAFCVACPVIANAASPEVAAASLDPIAKGLQYLGAGLATGISCIGGGIAVGKGAPAAIGATAEDAKNFGKAIIFVALGEGIALYGMLISILILNG